VAALRYLGDGGSSDAFNLGNERGYSVLEVIDAVRRAAGTDVDMTLADRRPGDPPSLVSSSAKARDTLQWRPRFPGIDAIVESAWRWHESEANDD
ncbi:MAG: UDP-glucose 4-epimerase GalE, partial [Deltaproteobacteria bacterium]|nr:UDP-glucose 4-epimerase GalE [Deltaproteobacteria bacterium]